MSLQQIRQRFLEKFKPRFSEVPDVEVMEVSRLFFDATADFYESEFSKLIEEVKGEIEGIKPFYYVDIPGNGGEIETIKRDTALQILTKVIQDGVVSPKQD